MKSLNYYKKGYQALERYFDLIVSKEQVFEINKVQLLYRHLPSVSKTNSKKVLFIHGWGSSMMNWYYQALDRRLVKYEMFFVDLPGHGGNTDFKTYKQVSYKVYTNLLSSFVRRIIKDEPIIVGHSMGGVLAKSLFDQDVASKAIYLNPAISPPMLPKTVKQILRFFTQEECTIKYKFFNKLLRNSITLSLWSKFLGDKYSHNRVTNDIITIADMYKTKMRSFWGYLRNMIDTKVEQLDFNHLVNDELLVLSTNDPTIPKDFLERSKNNKKRKCVVIEGGGHCIPRTSPELVNASIVKFI